MHDATEVVRDPVFGDEIEEVFPGGFRASEGLELFFCGGGGEFGGTTVDEDGLAGVCCDGHLGYEGGFLDVGKGVVDVVVVEADLADGDALKVGCEGGEFGEVFRCGAGGFLGVYACAGEDAGVFVRDVECAVHGFGAVADADGEDGMDAGCVGAGEDGFEVAGSLGEEVEMGVGVDEGHDCGLRILHDCFVRCFRCVKRYGLLTYALW